MPNLGVPELFIIMVAWIIPILLTAWLAGKKGYNAVVWVIISLFITWIALVILLVLPDQRQAPPGGGAAHG